MEEKILRKQIDQPQRRNGSSTNRNDGSYKNRLFGNKQSTTDEYTGRKIYYNQSKKHTLDTKADIDHVTPITILKERYKDDIAAGRLTLEDLQDIANSDYNLAATNARLNRIGKNSKTNSEYLIDQIKKGDPADITTTYNMLEKELVSESYIRTQTTVRKIGNTFEKFNSKELKSLGKEVRNFSDFAGTTVSSGVQSGLITATVVGIQDFVKVGKGEMSVKDAVKDISASGTTALAADVATKVAMNAATKVADKAVLNFAGKVAPIQIQVAVIVTRSVCRYLNDEATAEECVQDMILGGVGILAACAGSMIGGPAGMVVASIVVGKIQETVMSYRNHIQANARRVAAFNRIIREAETALQEQKIRLDLLMKEQQKKEYVYFYQGINKMLQSAKENNVDGITAGLNLVLGYFNQRCYFTSTNEFDTFFEDKTAVFRL